jgi:hypothetical protein
LCVCVNMRDYWLLWLKLDFALGPSMCDAWLNIEFGNSSYFKNCSGKSLRYLDSSQILLVRIRNAMKNFLSKGPICSRENIYIEYAWSLKYYTIKRNNITFAIQFMLLQFFRGHWLCDNCFPGSFWSILRRACVIPAVCQF